MKLGNLPTLAQVYARQNVAAPPKTLRTFSAPLLKKISVWQGDITKLESDAIVNAANRRLLGGGGVDGAIHRAAGPELLEECRTLNGAHTGESKVTKGYNLPSKHVIHTVGPIYNEDKVDECKAQLTSCYRSSLDLAVLHQLRSIAFCSISTGIYGYPIRDATHIALEVTRDYLESDNGGAIDHVVFVVFSNDDLVVYQELVKQYFPPESPPPYESSA